jgi:hypothetical protein
MYYIAPVDDRSGKWLVVADVEGSRTVSFGAYPEAEAKQMVTNLNWYHPDPTIEEGLPEEMADLLEAI